MIRRIHLRRRTQRWRVGVERPFSAGCRRSNATN